MPGASYRCTALVCGKTKLGESDLIVTCVREDGQQLRAVAKGARKPKSRFASRLDLFCVCDLVCAPGRNLDIVTEARLVHAHERLRGSIEGSMCASPVVEALAKTTQVGLEVPRLFDMACAALSAMDAAGEVAGLEAIVAHGFLEAQGEALTTEPAGAREAAGEEERLALCAAFLLKLCAMLGFAPQLSECVSCGKALSEGSAMVRFSYADGGCLCGACQGEGGAVAQDANTIAWARAFLAATFAHVGAMGAQSATSLAVLQFVHRWLRETMGVNLKSLNFLFASGLLG